MFVLPWLTRRCYHQVMTILLLQVQECGSMFLRSIARLECRTLGRDTYQMHVVGHIVVIGGANSHNDEEGGLGFVDNPYS